MLEQLKDTFDDKLEKCDNKYCIFSYISDTHLVMISRTLSNKKDMVKLTTSKIESCSQLLKYGFKIFIIFIENDTYYYWSFNMNDVVNFIEGKDGGITIRSYINRDRLCKINL